MSTLQSLHMEPLVNYFHPGKLADLSAVSFVTGILHKKLVHMRREPERIMEIYSSLDLNQITSIPKSIRSNLNELLTRTKIHWTGWWHHHHENVFFKRQSADTMIDWFDHLVWLPDGTINYEQTARKMLNNEKLTNVRKFQLACAYCFIDDVERLKQTLTLVEMIEATNECRGCRDEFLDYWSGKVRLEQNVGYENILSQLMRSLRFYKFFNPKHSKPYDEWPAFNFFFNQMPSLKRSIKIRSIIELGEPRFTWLLLPTLSDIELYSVISKTSFLIIATLLKTDCYFEFAMSVWDRMVHIIDNSELAKILRHVNDLQFERSSVNDLLWRMWLATSEHQKKFIVDERICDFTEKSSSLERNDYYSPNFPLIIDVLSRSSPKSRYRYWKNNWDYLVIGQLDHRRFIERIMNLCFVNDQQIQDFKKTSMIEYHSIAEYCHILLRVGRVKDIQTYLEFCTSDSQLVRDLKKILIKKMPKDELFDLFFYRRSDEIVADFNHFLEDVFTENERNIFFGKMVTRRDNLKKMRGMLSSSGNLGDVMKFIETFVSSEESLTNVKLHFFERCGCKKSIEKSVRLDLMAWCLNGDRLLVGNFKQIMFSKEETFLDDELLQKRRRLDSESYVYDNFSPIYLDNFM